MYNSKCFAPEWWDADSTFRTQAQIFLDQALKIIEDKTNSEEEQLGYLIAAFESYWNSCLQAAELYNKEADPNRHFLFTPEMVRASMRQDVIESTLHPETNELHNKIQQVWRLFFRETISKQELNSLGIPEGNA